MSNVITTTWKKVPDSIKRVLHTAWQVGGATLLGHLLVAKSTQDVKAAVVAAFAVALAAIKAAAVSASK